MERKELRGPRAGRTVRDAAAEGTEPAADERARIVSLLGPAPVLDRRDLVLLSKLNASRSCGMVLLELEIAGRLERHGGGLVSLV